MFDLFSIPMGVDQLLRFDLGLTARKLPWLWSRWLTVAMILHKSTHLRDWWNEE
jgi:hypothetical protein